jgi:hypothetical protein
LPCGHCDAESGLSIFIFDADSKRIEDGSAGPEQKNFRNPSENSSPAEGKLGKDIRGPGEIDA